MAYAEFKTVKNPNFIGVKTNAVSCVDHPERIHGYLSCHRVF